MTEMDYEELTKLIMEDYFTRVPLCWAKSEFIMETRYILDAVHRHMVDQDTCLVAVD